MYLCSPSIMFPKGGTGAARVPEGYVGLVANGKSFYRMQGLELSPLASYPRWGYGSTGSTMYGEPGSSVVPKTPGAVITLIPDTYSVLGTITCPVTVKIGEVSGTEYMHETILRYRIGPGGSVSYPAEVVWSAGSDVGATVGVEYEASIVDYYGIMVALKGAST